MVFVGELGLVDMSWFVFVKFVQNYPDPMRALHNNAKCVFHMVIVITNGFLVHLTRVRRKVLTTACTEPCL